ncbi:MULTISPECIES: 1-(5-phosphoribosyl)-5-[(5-phosphoribosylamino)methylideneamino]imidazole-4-carboxamide isomerase [unclassified Neisseria]|uniref:1-(5-phosphoribosyl)-5-[(5- phosphoribosylamino)methylideneamino]imidazole-4- carboxamide isomerase n=1 Tax=unclassified Neisseria TaxID=2623750 RepID=UPI001071EB47|nr:MULTISPECIES: 1-(5-phosphoribosyl)-5-[(5-phosphoribosylamino)methylideneamino]imidazole-4-carboxamide isomerase [unclassified Neisseria]MBF0804553.1 1-(5-phosphoribosyl)-5-[(5-phosphoribosylamino)methylideneamino]imidazole-4-carboxamide isomerase [Neisseria sp. 19428wB4_WF04]TFU40454.1 1-(5-phosphoribosyl)-5-[(5-phosphoribosylamino)methylideneamino]imidazole-4-carboxamide isomerase [Neisseria sp. WF04]
MLLIPAIDLKEGRCVRLKQGLMDQATVFSDNPAETALHWFKQGARRLHLVDLDGAFAGKPQNLEAVGSILQQVAKEIPVQLGGGIRDLHTIEKYLDLGLSDVIIGTAAVNNPEFVRQACREFAGRIIVGLDAKDGMAAINGWATVTPHHVADLGKRFEDDGVNSIIYTDIGRDGMMSGVNIEATVKLAEAVRIPVIASGGLTDLNDIRALCAVEKSGVAGAITGRAIYEGSIDFAEAQKLADSLAG